MRFFPLMLSVVLLALILTGCSDAGNKTEFTLIGTEGPAGGLIFYVDTLDAHTWDYIEAAPADQNNNIVWDTEPYTTIYASGSAVGYGVTNTDDTVGDLGTGSYAARACYDLEIVNNSITYDNWHLPTQDELTHMYTNLHAKGLGSFADDIYWSSTETAANLARSRDFTTADTEATLLKLNTFCVRAVRYVTTP